MAFIEKKTIIKNEIDYDKLAEAISKSSNINIDYDKLANAIITANKTEENANNKKHDEAIQVFREKFDIELDDNGELKKGLKNFFHCCRGYLEYGKEESGKPFLIFEVIKAIPVFIFFIVEIICYMFGIITIYHSIMIDGILNRLVYCCVGFTAVLLGSVLRLLKLEISVITKPEIINMIFSSLMAFLCALFALLALV